MKYYTYILDIRCGPGFGAFGFLLGTGDKVDLLWGITRIIRLALRLNPFTAHSDRVVRRGIPTGALGMRLKNQTKYVKSEFQDY